MDYLISDSVEILKENDSNLEVIYGWMDIGSNICEKQRLNKLFNPNEIDLINELNTMINRIKLDEDIILYRGLQEKFDPVIAEKQFNSLSFDLHTAESYG